METMGEELGQKMRKAVEAITDRQGGIRGGWWGKKEP